MAWLSFTELDKAVVHVIRWLLVCDYLSVIVVSVCLPSHALSQCLPSYLCFSYLGRGVSVHFQGKPFNITVIQVYAPTRNDEDEAERFYKDLQDL